MRYRVYFSTQLSYDITEAGMNTLMASGGSTDYQAIKADDGFFFVNLKHITHIIPVPESGSGAVIKPKSPEQIQEENDRAFAKVTMNPDNVLKKARGDELPNR